MKYLQLLALVLIVAACSERTIDEPTEKSDEDQPTINKPTTKINDPEELVEVKGHKFIQYYPGKKQIKFQGMQDDQKRRQGQWSYFSPEGKELSTTMYSHGKKHGHMIVKHDNGAMHYHGEMSENKKIGIWKNYDRDGILVNETDFGDGK
ncbi:MAG: hypothetical protein HRT57_01680 [Crocinitomicaceae bacterium]|nr:hypothetical protein [Crocinitomicaceae bacterium]